MEKLGINPIFLIAQLVNFGIILLILKRYLYKPILKILDERKQQVEESLKNSEKIETELENVRKKEEKILSDAKKEAQRIIEEARKSAEKVEKELLKGAQKKSEVFIKEARSAMEEDRKRALKDLERNAVDLVVECAKNVLGKTLDEQEQHEIIRHAINELNKADWTKTNKS